MKKTLFMLAGAIALVAIFACNKSEKQFKKDRSAIVADLAKKNLTALEDASGIFSVIDVPGSADSPTLSDTLVVMYSGAFLNGTVFDATDPGKTVKFPLNGVINGWKIAMPMLGKGGHGTFWIPSELCYGPSGQGSIGPNKVLVFEVTLVDFYQ